METLLRSVGFGVHSYQPFRRQNVRKGVSDLQYACKCTILRLIGLKRIKDKTLPLPNLLIRYLTTFSTEEFEEIECAPFTDVFNLHFCHRALTYRVRFKIDKSEYLAIYDSGRLGQVGESREEWSKLVHNHIMAVYAVAIDEPTGNEFYLLDTPVATLENVRNVMLKHKIVLPEDQLWKVVHQLSAALLHLLSRGLRYGPFGLDNLYLVDKKVVLENELTKKSRRDGALFRLDQLKLKEQSQNQQHVVENLGRVLKKLVYASCLIRSNAIYSEDLLKMIEDSQSWDPIVQPRLEGIRYLAKKMLNNCQDHSCTDFAPLCHLFEENRDNKANVQPCS